MAAQDADDKIWWPPEEVGPEFFQRDGVNALVKFMAYLIQQRPNELPAIVRLSVAELTQATFAAGVAWERARRDR